MFLFEMSMQIHSDFLSVCQQIKYSSFVENKYHLQTIDNGRYVVVYLRNAERPFVVKSDVYWRYKMETNRCLTSVKSLPSALL